MNRHSRLSMTSIQVPRPGGAWVGDVHIHHHHEDGHSKRPPPRNSEYATKLKAPIRVHVVIRTNTFASFWLVGLNARWRLAAARAVPMSRRRWISSRNLQYMHDSCIMLLLHQASLRQEATERKTQPYLAIRATEVDWSHWIPVSRLHGRRQPVGRPGDKWWTRQCSRRVCHEKK